MCVLATESKALNVVATSVTTTCFVFPNLIPKAKGKANTLLHYSRYELFETLYLLIFSISLKVAKGTYGNLAISAFELLLSINFGVFN